MGNWTNATKPPVLVVGVGNLIQADDGVGVHAVQAMSDWDLPATVEVFDGGTAGLDLLPALQDRRTIIVIDAVDAGMDPGTLLRFTPDDVDTNVTAYDSMHQLGLLETLTMGKIMGSDPGRVIILGVQPGLVDWGMELSDTVAASMPKLLDLVREELGTALAELEENATS